MASACKEAAVPEQFPVGLSVLVVDDDIPCLRILEQMLRKCMYSVTTCSQATVALNLLRERKGFFDIVLSDVHMPDMDGFKLLEHVGLEMDLPVIMMSGDDRTSLVMRGIRHGACDYLIKPIRIEELQNIWQHVVRKRCNASKEHEYSGSWEDNDRHKHGSDDVESSANEGADAVLNAPKKRKDVKEEEDDTEIENDDLTTSKKPRVVWSVELHQQFVSAVNQLGIDKAVPKRILELMNVPGLTRENVASHLQKFRLYLKRLSGVAQQQGGLPSSFCGPLEQNLKVGSLGRFDIQALAASGQIPPQTLAALHAELLNQPTGNLVLPSVDQPALLQASLPVSKCITLDQNVAYGQPLMKCPPNISKHFAQSASAGNAHSGLGSWTSKDLVSVVACGNITGVDAQNGNMIMSVMQRQQQQQRQQQEQCQKQSMLPEPSRSINVQPSCLVIPSHSSANFQAGNSLASVNQHCSFRGSAAMNYGVLSAPSNNSSLGTGKMLDVELKPTCMISGFPGAGSVSPTVSACSINADNGSMPVQNSTFGAARSLPGHVPNIAVLQGSYDSTSMQVLDHGFLKNSAFVSKGATIPSRFAVDEPELPISNLNQVKMYGETNGNKVKQEPSMDFVENAKVGVPMLQHIASNDLMSVFSD